MATEYLYPVGDSGTIEWTAQGGGSNYVEVDEVQGSPDDDTTYNHVNSGADKTTFKLEAKLSSSLNTSANKTIVLNTYNDFSYLMTDAPGQTGWTVQQLKDIIFGYTILLYTIPAENPIDYFTTDSADVDTKFTGATINSVTIKARAKATGAAFNSLPRVTQVYLEIDYTAGSTNHPAPTAVEIDRQTNPTNANEYPIFSAIFNAEVGTELANNFYIQVSDNSGFTTTVWDSGYLSITNCADGVRCDIKAYAGTYLSSRPPNTYYYVRVKFKDTAGKESDWSANFTMQGFTRNWHDNSYAKRIKYEWNTATNPAGVPLGYTGKITFKTGVRKILSSNGYFNEAIQASGGFQTIYNAGKTWVVFLGRMGVSDGLAQINIVEIDETTGATTEYNIGDAGTTFDTHNFPTICIDANDKLHVFVANHNSQMYQWTATNANDASAWGAKTAMSGVSASTYSVPFVDPVSGRIYVFYRGPYNYNLAFVYSDNNGASWSGVKVVTYDLHTDKFRVYTYGIRYDLVAKRLHISYTYTHSINAGDGASSEKEVGIWYAYADLDETDGSSLDVGFNIWRSADATLVGRTAPSGTYTTQVPIGYTNNTAWTTEAARAIQFWSTNTAETDKVYRIFSISLALLDDGSPVVFWEQKPYMNDLIKTSDGNYGLPTQETHLCSGTWSGSAWVINSITDQHNLMLRVRRSSIGVMTDRNGVMRLYMPVLAKPYHHFLPKATHDVTGITKSDSGQSEHQHVDDGFASIDGNGTYLTLVKSTGKVSFSNSVDSMVDNVTILGVEVRVVAQSVGAAAGEITPYLDISTTEYDGSALSVNYVTNRWKEVGYTWATNPSTSNAWTKSEVEGLQFGVKNLNATYDMKVTRVLLRVQYLLSSHESSVNAEIAELSSTDGNTWSFVRWHSGNSHIGVPIMNHAHHLQNEQVAIIWTSGHDIFLLTDEPYGLVQGDAKDVRLFYGLTEIDRIIDYSNFGTTEILFKIQDAVAANAAGGTKDLFLYFAGPSIVSAPLSDPANVYLWHNNMETYDQDDNLSGVDGWVIAGASGIVYQSPPGHANKIIDATKSLEMSTSGTADNTIGSGLTDILIIAGMWQESSASGATWIGLMDGSSNVFGGGVREFGSGGYAGYTDGTTFTDNTSYKARRTQPHIVEIILTADGMAIVTLNGIEVAFAVDAGITSADKVRLNAYGNCFFDAIRVLKRINAIITYTGALTDSSMSYEADNSSTKNLADALYESTRSDVRGIKVHLQARVTIGDTDNGDLTFKLHLCPESPYNSGNITDTKSVTITGVNTSTWTNHVADVLFDGLAAGAYSVKVDFHAYTGSTGFFEAKIDVVDEFVPGTEPVLVAGTTEVNGIIMSGGLQGADGDLFNMSGAINDDKMIRNGRTQLEHHTGMSSAGLVPTSWQQAIRQAAAIVGLEYKSSVSSAGLVPTSWQQVISAVNNRILIEHNSDLQVNAEVNVEWQNLVDAAGKVIVAWSGWLAVNGAVPIEQLLAIDAREQIPTEHRGSLATSLVVPVENLSSMQAAAQIQLASGLAFTANLLTTVENMQRADMSFLAVMEYAGGVSAPGKVPLTYQGSVDANLATPMESGSTVGTMLHSVPLEHSLQVLPILGVASIENKSSVDSDHKIPTAWLGSIALTAAGKILLEYRASISRAGQIPTSYGEAVSSSGQVPMEDLIKISRTGMVQVEWTSLLAVADNLKIPMETLLAVSLDGLIRTGYGLSVIVPGQVASEYAAGVSADGQVPVAWLSIVQLARAAQIPIEYISEVKTTSGQIPIEYGLRVTVPGQAASEYAAGVSADGQLPVSWQGQVLLSAAAAIPIEYRSSIVRDGIILTEAGIAVSASGGQIPNEYLSGISADGKAIVEWGSTASITRAAQIPIEHRSSIIAGGSIPLDTAQSIAVANAIIEENLAGINRLAIVPVSWQGGALLTIAGAIHVEYGSAVNVDAAANMEALLSLNRPAQLLVEYQNNIMAMMQTNIGYGISFRTNLSVSVEHLRGLFLNAKVSSEWLGLAFGAVSLVNARLNGQRLVNVTLTKPEITNLTLLMPKLSSVRLNQASIEEVVLHIAKIVNVMMKGGE